MFAKFGFLKLVSKVVSSFEAVSLPPTSVSQLLLAPPLKLYRLFSVAYKIDMYIVKFGKHKNKATAGYFTSIKVPICHSKTSQYLFGSIIFFKWLKPLRALRSE